MSSNFEDNLIIVPTSKTPGRGEEQTEAFYGHDQNKHRFGRNQNYHRFGHDGGVTGAWQSVKEGCFPVGVSSDLLRSWDLHQSTQRVEKRRCPKFQVITQPPGTQTMGAWQVRDKMTRPRRAGCLDDLIVIGQTFGLQLGKL